MKMRLSTLVASVALAFAGATAQAQISGGVVKIGVMNDMSGGYADIGGPGSVGAPKMAGEDVQKTAKAGPQVEPGGAARPDKPDGGTTAARQSCDNDGAP